MEDKNSSAHYQGYNSKSLGTNYDHISQQVRDKITDNGGIMDVKAEKNGGQELKGVRAVFSSKESRDNFNKELDKIKNKSKQQKEKKKDTIKAKTQSELDKEKINEIISQTIDSYLFENLKSPKLRKLSKLHGGLGNNYHGKSDNLAYTKGGNVEVPLSDITDDMLGDEIEYSDGNNGVIFRDGTVLPFKDRECTSDIANDLLNKHKERWARKDNDGTKEYISPTNSSALARRMHNSLKFGRNTINQGKEDKSNSLIRNGQNIVDRTKQYFKDTKKDKTLFDKTKRF